MDVLQAFLEDRAEREKDERIRCDKNNWSIGCTYAHEK